MKTRFRLAAAAVISAAALLLSVGAATGASAATTDMGRSGPEVFSISITFPFNPNGTVHAYGPVAGYHGTIADPSPTQAVFQFRHGNVYVWHTAEPSPTINWKSCTTLVLQVGQWKFTGGTGRYWGAFGSGHFFLRDFTKFPRKHGFCQAANPNAQPLYEQVSVQGYGFAGLPRHHH